MNKNSGATLGARDNSSDHHQQEHREEDPSSATWTSSSQLHGDPGTFSAPHEERQGGGKVPCGAPFQQERQVVQTPPVWPTSTTTARFLLPCPPPCCPPSDYEIPDTTNMFPLLERVKIPDF